MLTCRVRDGGVRYDDQGGMLIEIASFLPDNIRRSLARTERFLLSHGLAPDEFPVVATAPPPAQARHVVDCRNHQSAGDLDAAFTCRAPAGEFIAAMGSRDAERALATLAADKGFRAATASCREGDDLGEALRRFGVDPDGVVQPSVGGWRGASAFVAPDGDGFAFLLVEERGAIEVLARSGGALGAAFACAAARIGERIDVVGRLVASDRAAAA